MSLPFKRTSERGYILLDTLVAFAVLSFVLVTVFEVSTRAGRQQAKAHSEYQRTSLARAILEEYTIVHSDMPGSGQYKGRWKWIVTEAHEPVLLTTEIDHLFRFTRVSVEVSELGEADSLTVISTVVAQRGATQ